MRAWCVVLLLACGEPVDLVERPIRWRLAATTCQELGGARVEIEAGGLGVIAHGPCKQTELVRVSLPVGERELRAVLFDREERVLASGTAQDGAVLVMRANPELRGSIWLWPHLSGVAGCEVLGIDRYRVTLSRPWGDQQTRQVACRDAGDLMIDYLWPGSWQMRVQAYSAEGLVLGVHTAVRRIDPGQRRPEGDRPMRLDLEASAQPEGRVMIRFVRDDDSLTSCEPVGVNRLVIKARQLGAERMVEFDRSCGEELPDWSRLLAAPGSVDVVAEGLQDDQILYRGAWTLRFVPGRVMPELVLEPL